MTGMLKIWMALAALAVDGLILAWQVREHAWDWFSGGLIGQ
jgi:hypothetical protein